MEEGSGLRNGRAMDDEEYEVHERRKNKSGKPRKSSYGDEVDGCGGNVRRKSSVDRNESRQQVGGSSKEYSDEDGYELIKESYSDKVKKKQEESTLEKLSNWYGDRELEIRHDDGEKYGGRAHSRLDESEKNIAKKSTSKFTNAEGFQGRRNSKDERSHDDEHERVIGKNNRFLDRRGSSREKLHASSERGRKRLDDSDTVRNHEKSTYADKTDPRSGRGLDPKHDSVQERRSSRLETGEGKDRVLDSSDKSSEGKDRVLDSSDKSKSYSREDRRLVADTMKSRSRSDTMEEDYKAGSVVQEEMFSRERNDKYRENRTTRNEALESQERSFNPEEDGTWVRDKSGREIGHFKQSRTPDRSSRHCHESDISEMEHDRSGSLKRKELDEEVYRDVIVKVRDDSWGDRNGDRNGSKEIRKRRQPSKNDGDGDVVYGRDREWEVPRRGRDRMDNERSSGRFGYRRDGRGEAVIEIQPKPIDYGREDQGSSFGRKNDVDQSEFKSDARDDRHRTGAHESASAGDASKEKYMDEGAWKDNADSQGERLRGPNITSGRLSTGQSSSSALLPPFGSSQEPVSQGQPGQQGVKGARLGRTNRIRPSGRDNQQVNIPLHLMGPPFGPINMLPPGPMQQLNPAMSPASVPPIPPGVFIPSFSPPVWPGARGLDMSMLPSSSGVSPLTAGPPGQRFGPNMGTPPNPMMFFNQTGPGRGMTSNASGSGFNAMVAVGRCQSHDKASGGWVPPKGSGPPGKVPSRGEQNDYSQNFVDTGLRPQNFIRELELTNVEDYPKLRELIQKKDEIVAKAASPPMYYKCDLREFVLSPEFFGTKFDVILIDPPWEEYVHRAPGVTDHMESWTFEEIMNLKIEAIADTPSFVFLWVGDGMGLEQGRQCLKKWGFRRCEDICWVKTNKHTATPALRHDSHTLFQHTKEHCLMGIKGTVRRSTDGHIIHANIDTDVIIAEEPPYGSTAKPDEIYRIIEHFALGRRRIELFGEDHNIRAGWLTVGKALSSSNFSTEAYIRNFTDEDGKVWQGGGGRNPPPDTPHLVQTTPEIESLRPKSPMKNQQQLQQQSTSISLTANSSNRKPAGNSPQPPNPFSLTQDGPGEHLPPWAEMEGLRGRDIGSLGPHDNVFDVYGYNMPHMMPNGEFLDFDAQRTMNMM